MTDSTASQPPPHTGLPSTPRRREAEEWALVLVAEGFSPRVERSEGGGFVVDVEPQHRNEARHILDSWRAERAERAQRRSLPPPRAASLFETAAAYLLAVGLLVFHVGLEVSNRWSALVDVGISRAALVLDGQWWRTVTALTLHADLGHAAGNALFGGLFLAALAGRLGIGVALLAFVTSGTLGNLANALYYGSAHASLGASTGVFGLVGWLAGLAAWRRHQVASTGRGAWVAFGAGLAILAMTGSGDPRIDLAAHLFGLGTGAASGFLLAAPLARRPRPGPTGQAVAALLSIALISIAWILAGHG